MSTSIDDDLPGGPVRTLSAQRVNVAFRSDGSIVKQSPPPPRPDVDPETVAPTVAAPAEDSVQPASRDVEEDSAPSAALEGLPVDSEGLTEVRVTKDEHDDARPADIEHLTDKGVKLNEKKPLVGGVAKEDVWTLIRRFDKQVQHVRVVEVKKPNRLDLKTARDDEFSPDKLRSQFERLYLTVILGMVASSKHITGLAMWQDTNRSAAFCAVYFVAWFLNLLLPTIISLLVVLIVFPHARPFLFPPQRLTVIDHSGGNRPASAAHNEEHSADTLTGAPEVQKGEAAEKEASNFVGGLAQVAVGVATGSGPSEKDRDHGDAKEGIIPDPTEMASRATDAIGTAESGSKHHTKTDKTKQPMQNAVWEQMKPLMQGLNQLCDTWERVGNALSPTPPFHRNRARLILAAPLVPAILGIPLVSYDLIFKGLSFVLGASFFGFPWLEKYSMQGLHWLNTNYPNWPEKFDLGQSLLRGVPTNAQLTLTLLRLAEAQDAPLPPPPSTKPPAKGEDAPPPTQGAGPQFKKGDESSEESDSETYSADGDDTHVDASGAPQKKGARARIAGLLRGTAKVGAGTVEVTHRVKAAAGGAAKDKVGVLPPKLARPTEDGPDSFFGRHRGKRGYVELVRPEGADPAHTLVRFSRVSRRERAPEVEIVVAQIVEMRKVGGLGWKGKLVAGWALGEDVPDGVEVSCADGTREMFTAMPRRDELFDRLIAMGGQRWEAL